MIRVYKYYSVILVKVIVLLMIHYIVKRLLLIFPTLFGIMLVNFIIVQAAPGGPVQQVLAK